MKLSVLTWKIKNKSHTQGLIIVSIELSDYVDKKLLYKNLELL